MDSLSQARKIENLSRGTIRYRVRVSAGTNPPQLLTYLGTQTLWNAMMDIRKERTLYTERGHHDGKQQEGGRFQKVSPRLIGSPVGHGSTCI